MSTSLRDLPTDLAAAPARASLAASLALPLAMLAAALAVRALSFVPAVIDTDEGLYIVQAREWLRGGWPLVAVWDMHPIGAPAMVAAAMAILGESIFAVRLLGAICVAATGWAIAMAVQAAGAPRRLGIGAGLLYVGLTPLQGGLATNTEILFAPFVAGAMAIAIRGATRAMDGGAGPSWRELLGMGGLVGLALTVKPVATPEGCLAFALLTFPAWWRGALPTGRGLAMAASYALACALPTGLFALAYALHGQFGAFLDGSFLAPLRYAGGRLPMNAALWEIATAVAALALPMALALAGALWPAAPAERRLVTFGLLWFGAATLAIVGPGMFYAHYFLIWLPPLAVLAAIGAWRLALLARPGMLLPAFALLVGTTVLGAVASDAAERLQRGIGLRHPDPVRQVAAAVAASVPKGAPVLVANYHPVVQMLAGAGLATRFAFPAHFTGHYGEVAGIDMDAEVGTVLAARPAAIVVDRGWMQNLRPAVARMLERTLQASYRLAASVPEERGPVEVWKLR